MNLLGMTLLLALSATEDSTPEFYQDFRNKPLEELTVGLTKPDDAKMMKSEPEGLRITLPSDKRFNDSVGVMAKPPISGDFEITVSYQILKADRPTGGGFGVGIELYMRANSKSNEGVGLYRLVRPSGEDTYNLSQMTTNAQGQRGPIRGSGHGDKDIPASSKIGKLRITRVDSKVVLAAAEDGKDFQTLYHVDFVPEDLNILKVGAHSGQGRANFVDLRLIDMRIRPVDSKNPAVQKAIESTPGSPSNENAPNAALPKNLLWVVALLFAIALVIGGLLIWKRQKGDGQDENSSEVITQSVSDEPPSHIFTKCSGCGKKLKAKAELAGKKVKCSQCGQVVLVPQNN